MACISAGIVGGNGLVCRLSRSSAERAIRPPKIERNSTLNCLDDIAADLGLSSTLDSFLITFVRWNFYELSKV